MRVAWVTHHLPGEKQRHSSLLPGEYAGGAEMNNAYMVSQAPVDVDWIGPDDWQTAMDYERIVVTGTDRLTEQALVTLAERHPLVWIQHAQSPTAGKRYLFLEADPFVCMSTLHQDHEDRWVGRKDQYCHSPLDPTEIPTAAKEDFALFAARDHPLKGLVNARLWAKRHDVELVELVNQPRDVVLAAMARARWFVHLPKEFDACPRTVIEASIAGCEIVTNPKLVGRLDPGDPAEVVRRQPEKFWAWI